MISRFIRRFNDWFSSDAGVIQTVLVTVLIVAVELAFPRLDPHGFYLLFWLTVYSAITQPALANTGRHSDEALERLEKHQMEQQDRMEARMEAQILFIQRIYEANLVRKGLTDSSEVSDSKGCDGGCGCAPSATEAVRPADGSL